MAEKRDFSGRQDVRTIRSDAATLAQLKRLRDAMQEQYPYSRVALGDALRSPWAPRPRPW